MQLRQELPETVELADSRQIISEFGQKAATPVATRLSTEQDKIVLISVDDDCKDEIMDILTNDNFKSINISAADGLKIDLGKIYLKAYSRFNLIAASVEKNLNSFFRMVKQSVAGNIFVFDCLRKV